MGAIAGQDPLLQGSVANCWSASRGANLRAIEISGIGGKLLERLPRREFACHRDFGDRWQSVGAPPEAR